MAYQPGQWMAGALAGLLLAQPGVAMAQALADRPIGELKTEVRSRYDAALAMSVDPAVTAADTGSYAWASEAKVQCGIAMGFLKSNSKDAAGAARAALDRKLPARGRVDLLFRLGFDHPARRCGAVGGFHGRKPRTLRLGEFHRRRPHRPVGAR